MKVALMPVGRPSNIVGGTFKNYELDLGDEATFQVTRFLPEFTEARETLTRISAGGQELFLAKNHLSGRGQLVFLDSVEGQWFVYKLIGLPRNAHVDKVWVVTERGVHYPLKEDGRDDAEGALLLKQLIAEREGCELALTPAEQVFQPRFAQLAAAKLASEQAAKRKQAAEETKEAARLEAEIKRQAAEERHQRKLQLQSSANRRSFQTVEGQRLFGYCVADREQAKRLDDGKVAVLISEDGRRVVSGWWVNKSRGGKVSLTEINIAEGVGAPARRSATAKIVGATPTIQLQKFGTFVRIAEKRQEGDKPVVAYYATQEQLDQLKANRPEEVVTVAVLQEERRVYHVYRVQKTGVDDLGLMVNQPTEKQPTKAMAKQGCRHPAVSRKPSEKGVFLSA
jgi:hypothetical protein